jgi:hypothetical protein
MFPFTDITLYCSSPHKVGTDQYNEFSALVNYVSDLYVQCMHSYKPPNTSRVSLQVAPDKMWDRSWKNGSVVLAANYFHYDKFETLKKREKYQYILDIIQDSMLELSKEYFWDKSVFERAYEEVLKTDFTFNIYYPLKESRDKKKKAQIILSKTEFFTQVFCKLILENEILDVILFEKKNWWWYDSAYKLAKNNKWFDSQRFGISYKPAKLNIWYSITSEKVVYEKDSERLATLNLGSIFQF